MPGRLINLLESDLLQALPLYVLMGVLLNRMSVAPAVFRTLLWLLPNRPGAPSWRAWDWVRCSGP